MANKIIKEKKHFWLSGDYMFIDPTCSCGKDWLMEEEMCSSKKGNNDE